ncbi:Clavaminate synthase-like protein [Colletotrichum shisoi]|uniref:Clavaminate synthase-like protein n=1 Tax=Colletotrichum shisoi TaxID=2078593 RepID=A0A5Q4C5J2_9PEZI|nr:Clavaminate synthase-like protein [Colletotrichum shisoi]
MVASIASVPRQGAVDLALGKTSSRTFSFESFDLPSTNQRILGAPHPGDTVAPLALRPSSHSDGIKLDEVIQTIKSLQAQDGLFTKKLALHGTLLFRDLPIHDAEEFSRFAHSFGYKPHEIIGIVVDRQLLAPNVAPANESPKEVLIYNHNESPQVPHAPEYIFFFSQKAPSKGGETPISSSLELFHRAGEEIPDFIDELAQKGIVSKVTYKFDKQYAGGSTLRQAFGKDFSDDDDEETKRNKITHQIARDRPSNPLHRTGCILEEQTGGRRVANYEVTRQLYGDGSPIPDRYLEHLAKITDEITVLHKWKQGDVLVYDNIIAQHGRHPWEGRRSDRVVLASLFDGHRVPGAYGDADWAQVVQALDG